MDHGSLKLLFGKEPKTVKESALKLFTVGTLKLNGLSLKREGEADRLKKDAKKSRF